MGVTPFNELDMERLNNFTGRTMVEAIGFGICGIADQDTFIRTGIDLRVVSVLYEDECPASYFMEMREVGFLAIPGFERSLPNGSSWRSGGEITCSDSEFVPAVWGQASLEAHGMHMVHDGAVHTLHTTNVS